MGIINGLKFMVGVYKLAKAGGDYNTGEVPKKKDAGKAAEAKTTEQPKDAGWGKKAEGGTQGAGWSPKK